MHKIISRHFIGTGLKPLPGDNWVVQTSGTNTTLRGVAWSGSLFVVVGDGGIIRTSPDTVTWSAATSGTTQSLRDVLWANTQFVCVGAAGTILSSPTGTTWTPQTSGTTLFWPLAALNFFFCCHTKSHIPSVGLKPVGADSKISRIASWLNS